jgi:uncharacterized protein DUF4276
VNAKLYLEGGGDSKELHARCREGFRRLLERAGFENRMPRLVACGTRRATFDDFRTASAGAAGWFVAMLVDSEDPVEDSEKPWDHLRNRDGWNKPIGASDDQAMLMITSMETWIACDAEALRRRFGQGFKAAALHAVAGLEGKSRQDVLDALERATRACRTRYRKGRVSFEILGVLSPDVLTALPGFKRFLRILKRRL